MNYICIFGNYITRKGWYIVIHNVSTREEAIKRAEEKLLKHYELEGWYLERCSQI